MLANSPGFGTNPTIGNKEYYQVARKNMQEEFELYNPIFAEEPADDGEETPSVAPDAEEEEETEGTV